MLADLVDAGRKAGEVVLAVGVGQRERMKLPLRVEQVDPHAFEQNLGIVEVAVLVRVGMHAAADRAGQQFAEVVFHAVVAVVEHRAEDAVDAPGRFAGGRAAVAAGRVLAVEPAGRLHFAHAVRAGEQVAEFVEADLPDRSTSWS